ncbi:hypothetical protein V6Z11_A03G078900 [Gossypium hirsutum]
MGFRCMFKVLAVFAVTLTVTATSVAGQAKAGCQSNCGNTSIPYPFETGSTDCNISKRFFIRCNTSFNPPKAFLTTSDIEVLHISLNGYLRIQYSVGYDCYNSSGSAYYFYAGFRLSKFLISHTRNKFTAIGCDTYAYVEGFTGRTYSTGCVSFCYDVADLVNRSCSGIGCCQTALPKGVTDYELSFDSYWKHSKVLSFNPCSYGFAVEDGAYSFSVSDLSNINFSKRKFPIILDWTIGNQSCMEAKMDVDNYACKQNSDCIDPENGRGYLCKCLHGFQGNPYLSYGCQDINECETLKPCSGTCHNLPGSYNCSCPKGFEGDGQKKGTGCNPKRKLNLLKQQNFKQNGGVLLREQLSKREEYGGIAKIFTLEELKKAMNNYHESRILGRRGQGTVYKGLLLDGRSIAIKKSLIGNQSQVQPFVNEVIVLSQINHRNVVKLLRCCLETQVPLLVYEYVKDGTLFDYLHNATHTSIISWESRLKIAIEAVEALSYLHSAASPPIIHRDVKLTNILLDENYNAKVSDFCASRLVPSNKEQVTTLVQGTLGYLDPEYFHLSQLTKKSDVYSFGVVLIELMTGRKAISFERPEHERNLSLYFVSVMKEERLLDIVDGRVLNDKNIEQLKEERPTMKEVVSELQGLLAIEKLSWGAHDLQVEETEYLLHDMYNYDIEFDASTSISIGLDSIKSQVKFKIDGAR